MRRIRPGGEQILLGGLDRESATVSFKRLHVLAPALFAFLVLYCVCTRRRWSGLWGGIRTCIPRGFLQGYESVLPAYDPASKRKWKKKRKDSITESTLASEVTSVPIEVEMAPLAFSPKLNGVMGDHGCIMNYDGAEFLARNLPRRLSMRDWNLVFSTREHGYDLRRFLRAAETCGKDTVLVVLDSRANIFGGYGSESWATKSTGYFGTGESFVFSLFPRQRVYKWPGPASEDSSFMFSSMLEGIAFGGGGKFALHIDARLERGASDASRTFADLDTLLDNGRRSFKLVQMELWAFDKPY